MEDATDSRTSPELNRAIDQVLVEIEQSRARMRVDQAEIERLKIETKALQEETRAMLTALKKAA